jgi:Galactose oxidase, central domain/Kelch motif
MIHSGRWPVVVSIMAAFLLMGNSCAEDCRDAGCTLLLGITEGYIQALSRRAEVALSSTNNPASGDVLIIGGATTNPKLKSAILEFFVPATQAFTSAGFEGGRSGFGAVEFTAGSLSGQVLVAAGASGTASSSTAGLLTVKATVPTGNQLYSLSSGAVVFTGSSTVGRYFNTTTLLPNSMVLIAGGFDKNGNPLSSAEIFNPSTGHFSLTSSMTSPRAIHTATLLGNGKVLMAGGINNTQGGTLGTAEVYDPNLGTFTAVTGQMPQGDGVAGHTATLLATGNVLIAGGFNSFVTGGKTVLAVVNSVNTALLYDPTTGLFTTTGNLVDFPAMHSATLLAGGNVLIAGGFSGEALWEGKGKVQGQSASGVVNSAEIYNTLAGTFSCVGGGTPSGCSASMANARGGHSATIFASGALAGQVLLAGGMGAAATTVNTKIPPAPLTTAELFNPVAGKFKATGSMLSQHAFHSAIMLQ